MKKEFCLAVSIIMGITLVFASSPAVAATASTANEEVVSPRYKSNNELKLAAQKKSLEKSAEKSSDAKKKNAQRKNTTIAGQTTVTANTTNKMAAVPTTTSSIKKSEIQAKETAATLYNGAVNFTMGKDSNIDPDKVGVKDTFFEINPTLSFEGKMFSGNFGAAIRDYSEQQISEIAKKQTANAEISMNIPLSAATKSVTTIYGNFNNETWPDFLNGMGATDGQGMPIRYLEMGLTEKISMNLGSFNTDVGGTISRRDHANEYSDWSDDVLGEYRFQQDFTQVKGFVKVGFNITDNFSAGLTPSISQRKYDERRGRQTNGAAGGVTLAGTTPKYEHITSELAADMNLKFAGSSSITPLVFVGQTSDEALGAENNSFHGYGISANLVLDKTTQLTLSPRAKYKKVEYDNWINQTPTLGETRWDTEVSTGIVASINFSKNIAGNIGYEMVEEDTNLHNGSLTMKATDEAYRQEILSTTLTIKF